MVKIYIKPLKKLNILSVIAVAGFSLAGCGSLSWDAFKSTPPIVQVRLESVPPGADALTSLGPGCKTPCSVGIAASDSSFSVTYTMNSSSRSLCRCR